MLKREIKKCIYDVAKIEVEDEKKSLSELGVDSLKLITIIVMLLFYTYFRLIASFNDTINPDINKGVFF